MASSLAMPKNHYHVHSNSMPTRSHPIAERIENELIKLRKWENTSNPSTSSTKGAENFNGLSSLWELYNCVDDLLCLPLTQQEIAPKNENEERLNEVLDGSVILLDMCSTKKGSIIINERTCTKPSISFNVEEELENYAWRKKFLFTCASEKRSRRMQPSVSLQCSASMQNLHPPQTKNKTTTYP